MEEIDKLEHFTISRRRDGSFGSWAWAPWALPIKSGPDRTGRCGVSRACFNRFRTSFTRGPWPAQSPVFITQESYGRAKKEALRRHFDGLALNGTPKGTI